MVPSSSVRPWYSVPPSTPTMTKESRSGAPRDAAEPAVDLRGARRLDVHRLLSVEGDRLAAGELGAHTGDHDEGAARDRSGRGDDAAGVEIEAVLEQGLFLALDDPHVHEGVGLAGRREAGDPVLVDDGHRRGVDLVLAEEDLGSLGEPAPPDDDRGEAREDPVVRVDAGHGKGIVGWGVAVRVAVIGVSVSVDVFIGVDVRVAVAVPFGAVAAPARDEQGEQGQTHAVHGPLPWRGFG
jgi:hypothetical protein